MAKSEIELELINILSTFSVENSTETLNSIKNSWDYYNCVFDDIEALKQIFFSILKDFFNGPEFPWYHKSVQMSEEVIISELIAQVRLVPEMNSETFYPSGRISYCSRYVWPIRLNSMDIKEILQIKSYMGTGKTACIIQYLKNLTPELRILILSPRQLFSESICAELKMHSLIFENYLSLIGIELSKYNRLIIQMESLYKLQRIEEDTSQEQNDEEDYTPLVTPYDILIIDESESCFKQFSSDETMGERIKINSMIFSILCKEAKKIIALDAFLSEKTERVLKEIGACGSFGIKNSSKEIGASKELIGIEGHSKEFIGAWGIVRFEENVYVPEQRTAIEIKSQKKLFEYVSKQLAAGKKLFCMFSSKQKALKLEEFLTKLNPSSSIKLYCGKDTYPESYIQRLDLKDVRTTWRKYDCIITTSVITVGINFDLENYFSSIIIYGSCFTCCPRDVFQATMRVRHITENKLVFHLQSHYSANFAEEKMEEINERINKFTSDCIWLNICHSYNLQEDHETFFNYRKEFLKYLKLCNYVLLV